jgi:hypothetical protein
LFLMIGEIFQIMVQPMTGRPRRSGNISHALGHPGRAVKWLG